MMSKESLPIINSTLAAVEQPIGERCQIDDLTSTQELD